jgi:hypothetical protein
VKSRSPVTKSITFISSIEDIPVLDSRKQCHSTAIPFVEEITALLCSRR